MRYIFVFTMVLSFCANTYSNCLSGLHKQIDTVTGFVFDIATITNSRLTYASPTSVNHSAYSKDSFNKSINWTDKLCLIGRVIVVPVLEALKEEYCNTGEKSESDENLDELFLPIFYNTFFQWIALCLTQYLITIITFQTAMIIVNLIGCGISSLLTVFFIYTSPNSDYKHDTWDLLAINVGIKFMIYSAIILLCPAICTIGTWKFILLTRVLPMFIASALSIIADINSGNNNLKHFVWRFIIESIFVMFFGTLWTFEIRIELCFFIMYFANVLYFWLHSAVMPGYSFQND